MSFPLHNHVKQTRDTKCWFLSLRVVTQRSRNPQQALQQQLLLTMRKHHHQICLKQPGLKSAGGKGWANGEDPAGCCVPATPAEPTTNGGCSRARNTSSFQRQRVFLVASSQGFYVWPSNTSFKLTDTRMSTPLQPLAAVRRALSHVWLSHQRGWMPLRVTLAKGETFTGAIPCIWASPTCCFIQSLKAGRFPCCSF